MQNIFACVFFPGMQHLKIQKVGKITQTDDMGLQVKIIEKHS